MHPGVLATANPDKPAYIMAESGVVVTRRQLEEGSNQCAQLFRSLGLNRGDHVALMLENHDIYLQLCLGALRAGLYFTAISYRLQEHEVEYIVNDCEARVFITSKSQTAVVEKLIGKIPSIEQCFMLDGVISGFESFEDAAGAMPTTQIADESTGSSCCTRPVPLVDPKGC